MANNYTYINCNSCVYLLDRLISNRCFQCEDASLWKRDTNFKDFQCYGCVGINLDCEGCAHQGTPMPEKEGDSMPEVQTAPNGEDNFVVVEEAPMPSGEEIEADLVGTTDPNGLDQHAPGAKLDFGKTRWSLMPWAVVEGVAKVMTFGANKYSDNGWKSVPEAKARYFDALLRHKMLMDSGEYIDPDSGLPHWAHFCCNAIFLGYFYLKGAAVDA